MKSRRFQASFYRISSVRKVLADNQKEGRRWDQKWRWSFIAMNRAYKILFSPIYFFDVYKFIIKLFQHCLFFPRTGDEKPCVVYSLALKTILWKLCWLRLWKDLERLYSSVLSISVKVQKQEVFVKIMWNQLSTKFRQLFLAVSAAFWLNKYLDMAYDKKLVCRLYWSVKCVTKTFNTRKFLFGDFGFEFDSPPCRTIQVSCCYDVMYDKLSKFRWFERNYMWIWSKFLLNSVFSP